jgi:WD40 repeat protein
MSSENSFEALHRRISSHPGFVALLCDSDLVRLLRRPPDWEDLTPFHAEFFLRLWLYKDECPEGIKSTTNQLAVSQEFHSVFRQKAVAIRIPPGDSEPNYSEALSATTLKGYDRGVWDALKTRLIQFLECDGIFPLVTRGAGEAAIIPFRFTRAPHRRHRVYDEKREIEEWTGVLQTLSDSVDFEVGVEIAGEIPRELIENANEIGGSLGLSLILARERRRGVQIGWYWPLDLLATGAFHAGKLCKVSHVASKRAAGQRLNARLTVWPDDTEDDVVENHGFVTLRTNQSASQCVEALSTRVREKHLDRLDFHRACLCVRQVLDRRIRDLTVVKEIEEIETQLGRCLPILKRSCVPAASAWQRRCAAGLRAARVQRFWLRSRLAAVIGVFGLAILGMVWQWQEHRRREGERLGRIENYTEQGRQELLTGSPLRALPFFAEAYREGGTNNGLRLLLSHAVSALDSQAVSFGGPSDGLRYAAFSPDSLRLLTAAANNNVKVWSTTGDLLVTLPDACERMFRPSFSPDGSLIVTARGKAAKLWRTADGKLLFSLDGHKLDVKSAAFSSDGSRVVTASVDDTAKIWNTTDGSLVVSLNGHSATVRSAGFNPDGHRVLTISSDATAKVWSATTGEVLLSIPLASDGVRQTPTLFQPDCFSPDGRKILTLHGGQVCSVWSAETGKRLAALRADKARIISAMFSPDSTHAFAFSTTEDNKVNVWDIESEKVLLTLDGHKGWINAIDANSTGRRLVTASWDTTARVWDAASGKELKIMEGHKGFLVVSANYSPDGTRLVTVDGNGYARVWDMTDGSLISSLEDRSNYVHTLAFSPDGTRIANARSDRAVAIRKVLTGQVVAVLTNFPYPVTVGTFSRNGDQFVTASGFGQHPQLHDPFARVWDVAAGQLKFSLGPHSNAISSVAFNSDGTRILTTAVNGDAVFAWDAASGHPVGSFIAPANKRVVDARFNPDLARPVVATYGPASTGTVMLGNRDIVEVWDWITRHRLSSFATPNSFFYSVVFNRDGSRILTASADHNLTVWDASTGKALVSLHANIPFGDLAFWNPDGSLILTTDSNTVKIWDASTGRLLTTLEGHASRVAFAAFNRDGSRVATAGTDGAIRIWNLPLEKRSPQEIVHLLEVRSPWRLSNGQLVPTARVEQ